jgi:hypothetical protein
VTDKPKTDADRARALHAKHPTWGPQRIATEIGTSRQAVANALNADPAKRGSKPNPAKRIARLRAELAAAERELAAQRGLA